MRDSALGSAAGLALVVLSVLTCETGAAAAPQSVRVVDGVLQPSGVWVGMYTSCLQEMVVDKLFNNVTENDWLNVSLINSTTLRYLELEGDYFADTPLRLPSLFVLKLNGSLAEAKNLSVAARSTKFDALVVLNQTRYSAVLGGRYNATLHDSPGMIAISLVSAYRCVVRNVRAVGNFDSAIAINKGSENEISYSNIGGTPGNMAPARAIWCLATEQAIIHHNYVHHAVAHALDFDAYTSSSLAFGNICEDNVEEGIFVEETASYNVITNNTCNRNGNGIGLYSNAVGPVQHNFVFGNTVTNNKIGVSAGGYGHNPAKMSVDNIFVANTAAGNSLAAFNPSHGSNIGDFWLSNVDLDAPASTTPPIWERLPMASANVTVFDP